MARRGDIHPTGKLETFLHSDRTHQQEGTDAGDIVQTIWGTTVNIEDVMRSFREFIVTFTEEDQMLPFYNNVLIHVYIA
jgi:hypothetical protein